MLLTFGEKVKKLRFRVGLTQKDFATAIGSSQSSVASWENGKSICNPKLIEVLERWCKLNRIRINWRK